MTRQADHLANATLRVLAVLLLLTALAAAQSPEPQLVLENDFVRVNRVTIPAKQEFSVPTKNDTVAVRLQDESARFIPKGDRVAETNTTDQDAVELLVDLKRHWDAEVHPCSFPKTCTRETRMGTEPIAWTTTLFTNGFLTATTHKVVQGGTLTSSYYTSKGSDKIVLIPFTDPSLFLLRMHSLATALVWVSTHNRDSCQPSRAPANTEMPRLGFPAPTPRKTQTPRAGSQNARDPPSLGTTVLRRGQ
jgi:hypothetical protein